MDTCKVCTKCKSNNISELVWVNQSTGEIDAREDQYYCHTCAGKVEVIITSPPLSWVEDIDWENIPPLADTETTQ